MGRATGAGSVTVTVGRTGPVGLHTSSGDGRKAGWISWGSGLDVGGPLDPDVHVLWSIGRCNLVLGKSTMMLYLEGSVESLGRFCLSRSSSSSSSG